MATIVKNELAGCEGFRVESADGLLGWVEETWLDASGEPVALAVRTVDGREGLLVAEDVETVVLEHEELTTRPAARLLELAPPQVDTASSNGLAASWRTTGAPLDPLPEPPGAFGHALLAIRPWRLTPPPRAETERPLWVTLLGLYTALAVIVGTVIGLCFLLAWLVTGNAI